MLLWLLAGKLGLLGQLGQLARKLGQLVTLLRLLGVAELAFVHPEPAAGGAVSALLRLLMDLLYVLLDCFCLSFLLLTILTGTLLDSFLYVLLDCFCLSFLLFTILTGTLLNSFHLSVPLFAIFTSTLSFLVFYQLFIGFKGFLAAVTSIQNPVKFLLVDLQVVLSLLCVGAGVGTHAAVPLAVNPPLVSFELLDCVCGEPTHHALVFFLLCDLNLLVLLIIIHFRSTLYFTFLRLIVLTPLQLTLSL